jgi:hypothetical protein
MRMLYSSVEHLSNRSNELNTGSLKKDKNYRRYASSVERALSLFDNALQEWADYISFLSRLLKVRQDSCKLKRLGKEIANR